jgi:uncharacterized membrane protein YedE/YeeE
MKRTFRKYAIIIIAILLAELVHAYAHSFLQKYKNGASAYEAVALSMAVTVLVFYPAFHYIEKYIKYASEKYLEATKRISGGNTVGLFIGFGIAVFLLFMAFAQVWYQRNLIDDIHQWIKNSM